MNMPTRVRISLVLVAVAALLSILGMILTIALEVNNVAVGWGSKPSSARAQELPIGPPQVEPALLTFYLFYDENGNGEVDTGDEPARFYPADLFYTDSNDNTIALDLDMNSDSYRTATLQDCLCPWTFNANGASIAVGESLAGENHLVLKIVKRLPPVAWFPLVMGQ